MHYFLQLSFEFVNFLENEEEKTDYCNLLFSIGMVSGMEILVSVCRGGFFIESTVSTP